MTKPNATIGKVVEQTINSTIKALGSTPAERLKQAEAWDNSQAEITKQAFNEASGLIKALQTLKNRPHSKFDYAVTGDAERFDVITNISVENTDALTNNHWTSNLALIFDRATKETVANLGWRPRSKRAPWGFKQELKSDKNGDIINIVKYLTQAAVAQNLVV